MNYEQLNELTEFAKAYRNEAQISIQRNRHMNEIDKEEFIRQRHIDAILVDFINYVGVKHGVDYALYTSDLKEVKTAK